MTKIWGSRNWAKHRIHHNGCRAEERYRLAILNVHSCMVPVPKPHADKLKTIMQARFEMVNRALH
jgi:hypothetical protein